MVGRNPLAIDLFCGLGGWAEGFLAEGWDVIGFDIERHEYGPHKYPGQLVIQDVLTLHGSQFKDADCLVSSPPCQEYSYMAMPWSRGKEKAAAIRADATGAELERLNRLFNACFRIQREACEAARRHVPMVVENVRGAEPWVGQARWAYKSFYLWGDVPALMPVPFKRSGIKGVGPLGGTHGMTRWTNPAEGYKVTDFRFDGNELRFQSASVDGVKQGGSWWHDKSSISRTTISKSPTRKFASAMIAKIPEPLSRHIAKTYLPILREN